MGVLNLGKNKLQSETDWEKKSKIAGGDNLELYLERARAHGLSLVPFDVKALIESLGTITLKEHPMENEISGYFQKSEGKWIIGVNSRHHHSRKRFTLAHELGHYALHRQLNRNFEDAALFRDGDTSSLEWEANQFAADLLMPKSEFIKYLRTCNSIDSVSNHFDVSPLAVKIRAVQLGFSVTL